MIHIFDANAYLRQGLNRDDPINVGPRFVYNAANASRHPQIWVWDGARNNERRRMLFPGYKIRDYTGQEDIFTGLKLYRELLSHSRATQIEVPEWEADDVCGTLARHFAELGEQVVVFTNDFDFFQLTENPLIKIKGVRPIPGVEARYVSLFKAMVGDKSDKIDGIDNFGPKTFTSMGGYHALLDQALAKQDAEAIRSVPFKPVSKLWLSSDENMALLFTYYKITRMWDVPLDLIEKHTKPGFLNPGAAEALFRKFML